MKKLLILSAAILMLSCNKESNMISIKVSGNASYSIFFDDGSLVMGVGDTLFYHYVNYRDKVRVDAMGLNEWSSSYIYVGGEDRTLYMTVGLHNQGEMITKECTIK